MPGYFAESTIGMFLTVLQADAFVLLSTLIARIWHLLWLILSPLCSIHYSTVLIALRSSVRPRVPITISSAKAREKTQISSSLKSRSSMKSVNRNGDKTPPYGTPMFVVTVSSSICMVEDRSKEATAFMSLVEKPFLIMTSCMIRFRSQLSKAFSMSINRTNCYSRCLMGILFCLSWMARSLASVKNQQSELTLCSVDFPRWKPVWFGCIPPRVANSSCNCCRITFSKSLLMLLNRARQRI